MRWTSCPQLCATPGTAEEYGNPVLSVTGRASMSARSPTTRSPGADLRDEPGAPRQDLGRDSAAAESVSTSRVVVPCSA